MIKKKQNNNSNTSPVIEEVLAKEYVAKYKYVILNSFVTYMRINFNLNYTNKRAIELLNSFGLKRKRVSFETVNGIKHSKNEFINEHGLNKSKPLIQEVNTHEEAIEKVALNVLSYIKNNFKSLNVEKGIINFNLFNSDEGLVLVYDNQSLKEVLKKLIKYFSFDLDYIPKLSKKIREISETSYVRENEYNTTSVRVYDKKFYNYFYKGEK